MKTFLRGLIGLALLACATAASAQSKPDASGVWDVTVESQRGKQSAVLTIKTDGEKLSGTYKGQRGDAPVSGTIKGSEIKFSIQINVQGTDLVIAYSGTLDKDSMKGSVEFGSFGTGDWTAARAKEGASAASSSNPQSGDKMDVTGKWAFTVETDQGSGTPSFTFKQEGEKLTGTYKGAFGEAPVQGSVKGKAISFSVKVNAQGVEGVIEYTGTIEKDAMKGTVKLAALGAGTWTAKRE